MAERYGYAGKIIQINLSSEKVTFYPTSDYSDSFLGGRGIAAKLYWDKVPPKSSAFGPENCLALTTGPLACFPGLAGSRWQICGKTAATTPQHFSFCNLGGTWGAELKFAGYDGMVIEGNANHPVYIVVSNDQIEIDDASELWGLGAIETRAFLKAKLGQSAKILAIGPAGENQVVFASLLAENDASGSGGFGAICGAKKLKAIVLVNRNKVKIKAADENGLKNITAELFRLLKYNSPNMMTNFSGYEVKRKACWGCVKGCMRGNYTSRTGHSGKFMCQSSWFYRLAMGYSFLDTDQPMNSPADTSKDTSQRRYPKPDGEASFIANKLCDTNGLDTMVMEPLIRWLLQCHESGILTEADAGLPLSKAGSIEFIDALVSKISHREGFGDVLAAGIAYAARTLGNAAEKLLDGKLSRAGELVIYDPRMYLTNALLYAMEPRRPIQLLHEGAKPVLEWRVDFERKLGHFSPDILRQFGKIFLGSDLALDLSTYSGKALAVRTIQDREYAAESMIVCNCVWPMPADEDRKNYVSDPTLYCRAVAVVTGHDIDQIELNQIGERVFNLQRAILVKEGHHGRLDDTLPDYFFTSALENTQDNPQCLAPGRDGVPISRKGEVVDRLEFEQMKNEYYELRGWDQATGLQTRTKLSELGLQDIAADLAKNHLVT